jgi:hypothetical protein
MPVILEDDDSRYRRSSEISSRVASRQDVPFGLDSSTAFGRFRSRAPPGEHKASGRARLAYMFSLGTCGPAGVGPAQTDLKIALSKSFHGQAAHGWTRGRQPGAVRPRSSRANAVSCAGAVPHPMARCSLPRPAIAHLMAVGCVGKPMIGARWASVAASAPNPASWNTGLSACTSAGLCHRRHRMRTVPGRQ